MTAHPRATRHNEDGQPVYEARIRALVTLDQAAVALAVAGGRPDRARVGADVLTKSLSTVVAALLAGEQVVPPTSLVRQWRDRLIADEVFPAP